MNAAVARPAASTLLWTGLMTLPLLMPGARRRYGTIPVALGIFGLGRQVFSWMQARRRGPAHELRMTAHDPDITRTPHLRSHLE
jgi:hypothetical protein